MKTILTKTALAAALGVMVSGAAFAQSSTGNMATSNGAGKNTTPATESQYGTSGSSVAAPYGTAPYGTAPTGAAPTTMSPAAAAANTTGTTPRPHNDGKNPYPATESQYGK